MWNRWGLLGNALFLLMGARFDDDRAKQEPKTLSLSLREAVEMTLEHNLDIEIARYQLTIDGESIRSSLGIFDPVLYASGSGGESITKSTSTLAGAATLDTDTLTLNGGLKQLLPWGATLDAFYTVDRRHSNSSFATLDPYLQESTGGTVTLPLLKGFGRDVVASTIRISEINRDISIAILEKTLADSVLAVHQAYWNLVFARENKRVKEESLAVAARLLDENKKRFERGVLARVDVTQAESGVANQQEGILTAEMNLQNAADQLKRLVDPSLLEGVEVTVVPVDAPRPMEKAIDEREVRDQALGEALQFRSDYRRVRKQIESKEIEIVRAENGLWPKWDLSGTAKAIGVQNDFAQAFTEMKTADSHDVIVGFSLEIPLGNRGARGTFERVGFEQRKLHLELGNIQNQILLEVRQAVREIKTAEQRIEATRKARILAQEQFDGEMSRRDQGMRTTFHVLDAEEDLVLAKTNEIKALIDYNVAQLKLQQVSGVLLRNNGILIEEHAVPRRGGQKP